MGSSKSKQTIVQEETKVHEEPELLCQICSRDTKKVNDVHYNLRCCECRVPVCFSCYHKSFDDSDCWYGDYCPPCANLKRHRNRN